MEMITKNVPKRLEFGMEGNWGTLIPEEVGLVTYNKYDIHAVIKYNYGKDDGRTINLCHDELHEVDFESFGTTFEAELKKVGYKTNEVQQLRDRWYIIKEDDGTIVPFEKFTVEFDYLEPGFNNPTHRRIECETRGKERAISYATSCVFYPNRISNIVVVR